jgi:hypothetical protein
MDNFTAGAIAALSYMAEDGAPKAQVYSVMKTMEIFIDDSTDEYDMDRFIEAYGDMLPSGLDITKVTCPHCLDEKLHVEYLAHHDTPNGAGTSHFPGGYIVRCSSDCPDMTGACKTVGMAATHAYLSIASWRPELLNVEAILDGEEGSVNQSTIDCACAELGSQCPVCDYDED